MMKGQGLKAYLKGLFAPRRGHDETRGGAISRAHPGGAERQKEGDVKRVLFVCTGNICRSPTAEGVALHQLMQRGLQHAIEVDSAGTHGYHVGEQPDPRTRKAAAKRGYDLSPLRARKLEVVDFQRFDLLLAMDEGHLAFMRELSPPVYHGKIGMFMHYARTHRRDDVPDPYYGGDAGFEKVLDYCEDAVEGLLEELLRR